MEEVYTYSTDPSNPDSDNDKLDDYEEIFTYSTNPNELNSDFDGLSDFAETIVYPLIQLILMVTTMVLMTTKNYLFISHRSK